jgi:hypothetical protein
MILQHELTGSELPPGIAVAQQESPQRAHAQAQKHCDEKQIGDGGNEETKPARRRAHPRAGISFGWQRFQRQM